MRAGRKPLGLLGALLALYLAVPVGAFLVRLATSSQRGFGVPGLYGALWVSVVSATISLALGLVLGVPLAYVLARSRSRLASVVGVLVQLPLALPPLMSGILLIYLVGPYTVLGRLFDRRLTDSLAGVVLAQTFVSAPFLIVAARSAFAAVDPDLEDVAATSGHGPLSRFARVGLPEAAGGIRAGAVLAWLRAFGEYGATVIVAFHPYSLPVYTSVQFSASGLLTTSAPTALALGTAVIVVGLARVRPPRPWLRRTAPVPVAPGDLPPPSPASAVAFDLDVSVGTFRLRAAHPGAATRLAVLGPSGSGKSLTLRSLAGLLGPRAGTVRYGPDDVTATAVERRGVGYVPQHVDLFPHLTVWENVTFGRECDPAVAARWLELFGLSELGGRRPRDLSGGQRQRTALAQALARRPRLLLLDEPFSALDAPVRAELRRELRDLQDRMGLATVLVTHDPAEAALLAEHVIVLVDGEVAQAGPRDEVLGRPVSAAVARLVGFRNLLPGTVAGPDPSQVAFGPGGRWHVPAETTPLAVGTAVVWSVPPEAVVLAPVGSGGPGGPGGAWPAWVVDVVALGGSAEAIVELDRSEGIRLEVRLPLEPEPDSPAPSWAAGQACSVRVVAGPVRVWAAGGVGPPDRTT